MIKRILPLWILLSVFANPLNAGNQPFIQGAAKAKRPITLQELFSLLRSIPKKNLFMSQVPPPQIADLAKESDPQRLLQRVYEQVIKSAQKTDPRLCNQLFEPILSQAILKDRTPVSGLRKLRHDPLLCAAQIPQELGNVRTNYLKGEVAGCAATVYYGPQKTNPHIVKIHLKKIDGCWKIHDIHHQDRQCPGGICSVRKTLGLKG